MERETQFVFGRAPRSLKGFPLEPMSWQMEGDSFLLRGVGEHYFHYQKGCGVTIERALHEARVKAEAWSVENAWPAQA